MIKSIEFFGRKIVLNPIQYAFFNSLFNDDLSIKSPAPGSIPIKEFTMWGGVRMGKSFSMQLAGFLIAVKYPACRILWVRDTYDQLKDSVIQQFNDDFGYSQKFKYKKVTREAVFSNGSVIKFRAFDVDGTSILSTEYDLIAFCQCEDIPEEVFLMAMSRLSGQKLPRSMIFSEGNPASTWVKKRYYDKSNKEREAQGILFLQAGTEGNQANLPPDYLDFLIKNYPESWINRYVKGGWDNSDEMVFSEFHEEIHCVEGDQAKRLSSNIPSSYEKAIGFDYGFKNPSCLLWGYKDYDGCYFIYDEFYASGQFPEDIAREAIRHGPMDVIADYAIKQPDRDGVSLWQTLVSDHGLSLIESNKDELRNLVVVNSLFKQNKIHINADNCPNLVREIKNYKWQRHRLGDSKNAPEKPIDKDNHCFVAGSLVLTKRGNIPIQVPIQSITHEDFVWTPLGFKRVLMCGISGFSQTYIVSFSDGSSIQGTGSHRIYVNGVGMRAIDALQYGDIISSCHILKMDAFSSLSRFMLNLMVKSIVGTRNIWFLLEDVAKDINAFIRLSGYSIMGKFLKVFMYIISTIIAEITRSRIWLLSKLVPILLIMLRNCLKTQNVIGNKQFILNQSEKKLKNGMQVKLVSYGTKNMEESAGKESLLRTSMNVEFAKKDSLLAQRRRFFAQTIVVRLIDAEAVLMTFLSNVPFVGKVLQRINTPQSVFVQKVVAVSTTEKVFDLTVEDCSLFYCNNILVSNSLDSLIYLLYYLELMSSEDPKKREGEKCLAFINEQYEKSHKLFRTSY